MMNFMIALPKSVRRFLSVFFLASLCAYFSYIAYITPYISRGLTLAEIENLEEIMRSLPRDKLTEMRRAGLEAKSWLSSCALNGRTILSEITHTKEPMPRSIHAPKEDVFDEKTGAQYYFHKHRGKEEGHFHLFLWTDHIPGLKKPVQASPSGGFIHLIALATDARGYPIRLFTTNQWVTGEDWRPAKEVSRLVPNFEISHGEPSWPANRSLTAFVRLFAPQIKQLIDLRDEKIEQECSHRPLKEVLSDRSLEVLSEVPVDLDAQLLSIEAALAEQSQSPQRSRPINADYPGSGDYFYTHLSCYSDSFSLARKAQVSHTQPSLNPPKQMIVQFSSPKAPLLEFTLCFLCS